MTTGSVSPRRADTRRNHERILAVAAESLSRSVELSFNAIAKQAGVGVGTVYRHFPTPEALILAVYQREVRHLADVVPRLLAAHPPEVAFRVWTTDRLAHYMMTKRGLADALRVETSAHGELARERVPRDGRRGLDSPEAERRRRDHPRRPDPGDGPAGAGRAALPQPRRGLAGADRRADRSALVRHGQDLKGFVGPARSIG
jgi:AcrR family transcriptional regulator